MINTRNEIIFLLLNIKAFLSFKLKAILYFFIYGHFVRKRAINYYYRQNNTIKIHLGANKKISNFLNSQILGKIPIDITKKLPFEKNSVDVIFSTHVVEHIHRRELDFFISESFRVLKKNGMNVICTPSVKKIFEAVYLNKNENKNVLFARQDKWHNDGVKTACHQINLSMRNFGHRFLVDQEYMDWLAKKNKFEKCYVVPIKKIPDKDIKDYVVNDKNNLTTLNQIVYFLNFL